MEIRRSVSTVNRRITAEVDSRAFGARIRDPKLVIMVFVLALTAIWLSVGSVHAIGTRSIGFRIWSGSSWVEPTTEAAYDVINDNSPVLMLPPGSTDAILFKLNWSDTKVGFVKAEASGLPQLSSILHRELAITTGSYHDLVFTGVEGGNTIECTAADEANNGVLGYRICPKPGYTWDDIPPGYLGIRLEVADCPPPGQVGLFAGAGIAYQSYVTRVMSEAYVSASVPEGGDGSFESPFRRLNEALHIVLDGTIYLFPGTYSLPSIGREGASLGGTTTLRPVPGMSSPIITGIAEIKDHSLRFENVILQNTRFELDGAATLETERCEEQNDPLQIFSPNGGETYWPGDHAAILWDVTEGIDEVLIQYSLAGYSKSETWHDITASTPNDGSHVWAVPEANSTNCFIRIWSLDGEIKERSDAPFAVAPRSLTLLSPNEAAIFQAGQRIPITWTSPPGAIQVVAIQYSLTGPSASEPWYDVIASTPNDGSYAWTLPDVASTNCYLRVSTLDRTTGDQSDTAFTIAEPRRLTLLEPNGGEMLSTGDSIDIRWESEGEVGDEVLIRYSLGGRSETRTWYDISTSTGNDGSYTWTIPNAESTNCFIRIESLDGDVMEESDAAFTITPRTLTLLSPNGGESFQTGQRVQFNWRSTGDIENVSMEYSITGPSESATWYVMTTSTLNDNWFAWTIPDTPSENCFVRVSTIGGEISDRSDSAFAITEPRILTLLSPNGGEDLLPGTSFRIRWESEGEVGGNVQLQYSLTGISKSETWYDITSLTPNDGSFTWTVPEAASNNCYIRLWSQDENVKDKNDAAFTIVGTPKTLKLLFPNGGEVLDVDDRVTISWQSTGAIDEVLIQYSLTGPHSSEPWYDIASSTPNDGSYGWTIPSVGSDNCYIQLRTLDSEITERSDAAFTMGVPRSLTIQSPNGGETFKGGDTISIQWKSTGAIDDVLLQYSLTGRSKSEPWYDITTSTPNDGSYTWVVPDTPTYEGFIRIWSLDGEVTEKNDTEFTIMPAEEPRTLTLLSPDGGEVFEAGATTQIEWESTGDIDDVRLQYSLNGPAYWISIIDGTPNDGVFEWIIPYPEGTEAPNCYVRLQADDTSNARNMSPFTITNPD